jgi:hypothetical protein
MDDLDAGAQPRCPDDGTVMRDLPGGWACGECDRDFTVLGTPVETIDPPGFDGPSIHGG